MMCKGKWCENNAGPSGYCRLCEPHIQRTYAPVDLTTCVCGLPAVRDGLCAAHDAIIRPTALVGEGRWLLRRVRKDSARARGTT